MRCHVSCSLCGVEGERKWAPLRNRRNESEASFDGKLRMDWISVWPYGRVWPCRELAQPRQWVVSVKMARGMNFYPKIPAMLNFHQK